jgi:hypothetical protein
LYKANVHSSIVVFQRRRSALEKIDVLHNLIKKRFIYATFSLALDPVPDNCAYCRHEALPNSPPTSSYGKSTYNSNLPASPTMALHTHMRWPLSSEIAFSHYLPASFPLSSLLHEL